MSKRYAILWSGGKDSALALHRTLQDGLDVRALVNFVDRESDRVRFHAVRSELICRQARALDLEIFQFASDAESFPVAFAGALESLKSKNYAGVIAGDIHLDDARDWHERQAMSAGLELVEPLWHSNGRGLIQTFVATGFRAVLTCTERKWEDVIRPGEAIDAALVARMSNVAGLDINGERGEYHSFVYDGPRFSQPVRWRAGTTRESAGFLQLDLVPT